MLTQPQSRIGDPVWTPAFARVTKFCREWFLSCVFLSCVFLPGTDGFAIAGIANQLHHPNRFRHSRQAGVSLRELESRAQSIVGASSSFNGVLGKPSPRGGGCEATGGGFTRMWAVGGGMWAGRAVMTGFWLWHRLKPPPRPGVLFCSNLTVAFWRGMGPGSRGLPPAWPGTRSNFLFPNDNVSPDDRG